MVEALALLALRGRTPRTTAMDNGPEFTSKALDQWAYQNGVEFDLSQSARQAHSQRHDRGIQRQASGGMSERELVPVVGRC